jgi:parallel beta-helix repeat protein
MTATHRTLTAGLLLATGLLASASADTITVCLDGSCDFTDPAAASAVAVTGDVIQIAAGTYLLEEPVALYGQDVDIRGAIDAQGAPATILDGQDKGQVFGALHISDEVVFENLVLANGRSDSGGAVHAYNVNATFRNCIFRDNHALNNGGAMFLNGGSQPTLIDCELTNNRAEHPEWDSGGGGAAWVSDGRLILVDCVVSGNNAKQHTGAIFSTHEDALVLMSTIVCGNTSPDVQVALAIDVANLGGCISDDCDSCETWNPADFNRDGVVGGQDLALVLAHWGSSNPDVDLNLDGIVGGADMTVVLSQWD